MIPEIFTNVNLEELVNSVANEINEDFFRLKSSYKSLRVYEIWGEIIKSRGAEFKVDFEQEDYSAIKKSILRQLSQSKPKTPFVEVFYLGNISNTLIHANVPVPNVLEKFGKLELSSEEIL